MEPTLEKKIPLPAAGRPTRIGLHEVVGSSRQGEKRKGVTDTTRKGLVPIPLEGTCLRTRRRLTILRRSGLSEKEATQGQKRKIAFPTSHSFGERTWGKAVHQELNRGPNLRHGPRGRGGGRGRVVGYHVGQERETISRVKIFVKRNWGMGLGRWPNKRRGAGPRERGVGTLDKYRR